MNPRWLMVLASLALLACGSDDGSESAGRGDVELTTWGEDYIETGIPSEKFADGWSLTYSKFLVVIDQIVVADSQGRVGAELATGQLFDLTRPGPHRVGTLAELPAKNWDRFSYRIAPPDASTQVHSTASAADLSFMQAKGFGVYLEASAKKGTQAKTLAWGFEQATRYSECKAELDGKETHGVLVTSGGTDAVELTVHGDHPFYDDLAAPDAVLRFDPMAAADAAGDGEVELSELAAVKLSSIPQGSYGVGAANIDDLGQFVRGLASTLGHFRGEGECVSARE